MVTETLHAWSKRRFPLSGLLLIGALTALAIWASSIFFLGWRDCRWGANAGDPIRYSGRQHTLSLAATHLPQWSLVGQAIPAAVRDHSLRLPADLSADRRYRRYWHQY